MKTFTKSLMALSLLVLFAFNSGAQVNIGSGTLTGQALPVEPFYGFTYSQSIYLASEINASGNITGITFYADAGTSIASSNDWTVYIGHTTKASFADGDDWETGLTQAFTGTATIVADQVTITFAAPFAYNGTDNLMIAVDENAAGFDGNADEFLCSSVGADRSLSYRNDNINPDPATPPTATFVRQSIPNIQLIGITASCSAPTGVTASSVTATSASISWTSGSVSTTSWDVSIVPAGDGPVTGSGVGTNPYNATGLTSNTAYDVYVRDICAPGDSSTWTGPVSFVTPCATFTPAYLTDFGTYLPACWDEADNGTPATGPTAFGAGSWIQNGTLARINLFTTGKSDWLVTPTFDLSAGGWELVVEASGQDFSGGVGTFSGMGSDDTVQVVISTDGGATWTSLYTFDTNNNPAAIATDYIIDLSAYTGASNQFGIWASEGAVDDGEDYYANIHSFEIRQPLTCVEPTLLTASNVMATSADIAWTAGNASQLGWEVSVVPSGDPAVGGTAAATNAYNATGLMDNTTYDVYVREICAAGDTTVWVGPTTFTTPCAAFVPAYLTDFATFLPTCWDEATNGDEVTGPTGLGLGDWGQNGTDARVNLWDTGTSDWLLTPDFDLSAGGWELVVEASGQDFGEAVGTFAGMGSDDSVQVLISEDGGATWTNIYTFDTNNEPAANATDYIIDLSAYTGTATRFGILGTEGAVDDTEDYYANIHSFEIRQPLSCVEPTLLTASNVMATSADIAWTAGNASQVGWEVSVVPNGDPAVGGTAAATNAYNATGLMDNTAYDVYVREICAAGDTTAWVGPITFTTPCATFVPAYLTDFATFLPACWDEATDGDEVTGPTGLGLGDWGQNGTDARVNLWNTGTSDWLLTPDFDLSAGGWELVVEASGQDFSGGVGTFSGMGSDDSVQVLISEDGGATWTNIYTFDTNNEPAATATDYIIDLSAYTGTDTRFGILGTEGAVDDTEDYYANIHSFEIRQPVCVPTTGTDVQTACDSLLWLDGVTYYASNNTATFVTTNAEGCDSTITLDLTINTAVTSTDVQTACDSLVWNGMTYTTSGMYTWTGTAVTGCDSTVTLDLTINNGVTSSVTETACDSLVWNGMTYTTSGTYTWTGTTVTGCDSTVTLDLTINNAVNETVTETACGSYDWNGMTYTTSGMYTWTGTTVTGCDSTVTLDLTINTVDATVTLNDPSISANATGATYQWIDCDNNNAPIAGETAQMFTATANGNYAVIVTENGCVDTSACQPIVTVSLDEPSALEAVSVYPNPVKNVVNVELAGLENAEVRLLDMSGKVLRAVESETTDLFTMEMNEAPGAYIIEVRSNEFVKQFKLIKE